MPNQLKVIASMIIIVAVTAGVSIGIAALLPDTQTLTPAEQVEAFTDLAFSDTTAFSSKPFALEEGYTIQLVDGWELVSHTPTRHVDRYRFERTDNREHIFTISVYNREQTPQFADLITARYGAAYLREQADVQVSGLAAKRITADFLDMGSTADVLVEVNDQTFISLYGVRQPSSDSTLRVAKEINYMQKSFQTRQTAAL